MIQRYRKIFMNYKFLLIPLVIAGILLTNTVSTPERASAASFYINSNFVNNALNDVKITEPGYISGNDCSHWLSWFLNTAYNMPAGMMNAWTDTLVSNLINDGDATVITGDGHYDKGGFIPQSQATSYFNSGSNSYLDHQLLENGGNNEYIIAYKWSSPTSSALADHLAVYVENGQVVSHGMTDSNGNPGYDRTPRIWYFGNGLVGSIAIIALTNKKGPTFTGSHTPVVGKDADGRMEVFEVAQDNQLWHDYQVPGSSQWSGWVNMGGSWPNDPAVSLNSNGTLEVFIVGNQGANGSGGGLFHAWQTSPGGTSWTGWNMMSGAWPAGVPAVASNLSGAREVFMRGLNANLYHAWQCGGCSGGWSGWYPMGGYWNTNPVAADNSNGTMTVFMIGESTQLYIDQEATSGGWSGWISLGGSWPGQPSVGSNLGGELEVFLRGNDGNIYHGWQSPAGSMNYRRWYSMGASGISRNPIVSKNADGRLEVFVVAGNTSLYDKWEDRYGNWSNWNNLYGSWPGQPAIAMNLVNGLEIFMTGNYPVMYHEWQVSSGSSGSYTGWVQLT